ncbi:LysR family transcriptional regulator [Crenobacter cavernae]|uniref:LysR family transcriptional regulator n=1 Tax=Crenobacter cavernae TaxID=2290923 RepID=A0A345Y8A7_9NEIS|nr:LysR family transcriptional regulator [Crenobacter cavernae]AXK40159.1 LysR family transcriptional regulator [Crenobacter cavernae]
MQQDLNDLYYFAQVADHQGFAPAGRALGIPKSKLSRRVALLEERLGVRLIQRSTRRFSVTEVGQRYYVHCKAMLVEADAAQDAIDVIRAEPQGIVRLSCPVALLHARVGAMLAEFMVEHPKVTVLLDATNRAVDVIGEGVDVAIRVRVPPLKNSDLVMKLLGKRTWCLVASPALLGKHGVPAVPADLSGLPSLDLGPPQPEHVWQLDGPDGAQAALHHTPRLVTDDMVMLREAAIAGAGVVTLPTMMIREELEQGRLVRVIPDWAPKGGVIHAVFPSRRGLLPAVRQLIDFLALRFGQLEEN